MREKLGELAADVLVFFAALAITTAGSCQQKASCEQPPEQRTAQEADPTPAL